MPRPDQNETQAAVAVTIAWMLTCMSTLASLAVALVLRLLAAAFPVPVGGVHPLSRVEAVLMFVAVITGCVCLALAPIANRLRRSRPPRGITIAAIVIGAAPLIALIVFAVFRI